jgi:hypothetical protein
MAKILIYNNSANRMEVYYKGTSEAMPYNSNRTLTVKEFTGSSNSNILWTDLRTMESWNSLRYLYGSGIYVGFAFKRCWQGGHSNLSQHYVGTAFDVGQTATASQRATIRNLANGIWTYVEPASLTPTWVHFDDRWVSSGYPITKRGSKGIYVCVAQDALTTLGYNTGGLDGIFGANTEKSVREYQTKKSITSDGILGPVSWRNLMADVVGKGSTSTTVN